MRAMDPVRAGGAVVRRLDAWAPWCRPAEDEAQVLFVRHAARTAIDGPQDTTAARLTPQGERDARAAGRALADAPLVRCWASPIQRCVDTARLLWEGWGEDPSRCGDKVQVDPMLANAFIEDFSVAQTQFTARHPRRMVLDYLAGVPIPGFGSQADGCARLMRFFDAVAHDGGVVVCVSHDALIMPFLNEYADAGYGEDRWLDFLEGALLRRRSGRWYLGDGPLPG